MALSMAGLVLSTVAVHVAAELAGRSSRGAHTAVVEAASVGTYGVLWLAQFALCDRVLFGARPDPVAAGAAERPQGSAGEAQAADQPLVAV